MDEMKIWRLFFAFVAAFNLLVGGFMLFAANQAAAQLGLSGAAAPYAVALAGLLIAVFGLAYAIVAWNPLPNRTLVTLGAIGKASAAVLASYHAYLGHIGHGTYVMGVFDLVLALIFVIYLRQTRKAAPT